LSPKPGIIKAGGGNNSAISTILLPRIVDGGAAMSAKNKTEPWAASRRFIPEWAAAFGVCLLRNIAMKSKAVCWQMVATWLTLTGRAFPEAVF